MKIYRHKYNGKFVTKKQYEQRILGKFYVALSMFAFASVMAIADIIVKSS